MSNYITNIFTNKFTRWFLWFGGIFILLVYLYVVLHQQWKGEENINFTDQEIANIQTIVNTVDLDTITDSLKSEKIDSLKAHIKAYVISRYHLAKDSSRNINGEREFNLFLSQYANANFPPSFLTDYRLEVHSYFWLTEDLIFLEIVFWSLFGVLCSLFYYISEAIVKNEYNPKHEFIHAAKLFYAPLTTLVVYFSLNALISNGEVNLNSLRHGLIILSFVLGFFSGRTIELLNRIKDLILPHNRSEDTVEDTTSSAKKFEGLNENEQHKILVEAKRENEEKWKTIYSNVAYLAIGNKYIENEGKKTEIKCIVFYVKEKITDNYELAQIDSIPDYVEYKGYLIPTDVQQQDDTPESQFSIRPLDPSELYNRRPGSGISRRDSIEFGSIGLIVYRGRKEETREYFILSCFHVLCNQEMRNNWTDVSDTNYLGSPEVVCPCLYDDENNVSTNVIANITEGVITPYVDAAIAKLKRRGSILDLDDLKNPTEIYEVKAGDMDKKVLQMRGRVSSANKGKIKHISSDPPIDYKFISKDGKRVIRKTTINMKELIQTEKISEKGDSGGPVFTEDGKVVGIIVGGSQEYSYIIPIKSILNRLFVSV